MNLRKRRGVKCEHFECRSKVHKDDGKKCNFGMTSTTKTKKNVKHPTIFEKGGQKRSAERTVTDVCGGEVIKQQQVWGKQRSVTLLLTTHVFLLCVVYLYCCRKSKRVLSTCVASDVFLFFDVRMTIRFLWPVLATITRSMC